MSENQKDETTTVAACPHLSAELGETIYRHFDGMCWPASGDGLGNLEWILRYGNCESRRLVAASVVSAYSRLIEMPEKKRNAIIRELRKGPGKASPNEPGKGRA